MRQLRNQFTRYFVISFLGALLSFLQTAGQSMGMELGFGIGASIYQGDLSPHWIGAYNRPGPSAQLMLKKNLFPGFAVRANYAYSYISDNEENYTTGVHRVRKFSFETNIHEFSAQVIINPRFNNDEEVPGNLQPYFFGGAGIAFLNIKRDWSRFDRNFPYWQSWVIPGLMRDSMTVMPNYIMTFPVGMGLRFQIGEKAALYGEVTKRITSTEYIDGFSRSANRRENDGFASLVFGLTIRLGSGNGDRGRIDCPEDVY